MGAYTLQSTDCSRRSLSQSGLFNTILFHMNLFQKILFYAWSYCLQWSYCYTVYGLSPKFFSLQMFVLVKPFPDGLFMHYLIRGVMNHKVKHYRLTLQTSLDFCTASIATSCIPNLTGLMQLMQLHFVRQLHCYFLRNVVTQVMATLACFPSILPYLINQATLVI